MITKIYFKCLPFVLFSILVLHAIAQSSKDDERKIYIVYLGELPEVKANLIEDHNKLLEEAIGDKQMAKQAKVYSYRRSLNGFAAKLLPHEADRLSHNENVVSVFPSIKRQLLTTRSWDFLGMPVTVGRNITVESDIIIGILDTGIYVPSKSFSGAGYGPLPQKWKGICQTGDNFTGCNNKVIGARYFNLDGEAPPGEVSPADFVGHGTHTSSTAAGVTVGHASFFGLAEGTARGGVPHARIAMYKVCWSPYSCPDADVLAGFDAAIADGVDIISASLAPSHPADYFKDGVSIGSFHAVRNGIFVSAAAGNDGPGFSTVNNLAPWMLTVAASTIDRVIDAPAASGNRKKFNVPQASLAILNHSRETWTRNAPRIASFSSRGPDVISNKILKPDIAAPGESILAAFTELVTLRHSNDRQRVEYSIKSGTSMACPHAASAIAYIKSFHPDWSPAALRSALMTTAKSMEKEPEGAELASGSGNINPVGAVDPGLVYDMDTDYYISFLCQNGYNDTQIAGITGNKTTKCSDYPVQQGHDGLNYPSMHYQLMSPNDTVFSAVFYRTVTHLGEGKSKYVASSVSTEGLNIDVVPNTLYFLEKGQKASFKVTLEGKFLKKKQWYLSGSLIWNDPKHSVKSPVLVYRPQT